MKKLVLYIANPFIANVYLLCFVYSKSVNKLN